MKKKFQLNFENPEIREIERVSGEIDDTDWKVMEDFIHYTEELNDTNLVKTGMQFNMRISWGRGAPMQVASELPPWEEVIVFLHKIRPLLLQSESTNFYRVNNFLSKILDNPTIRSYLAEQKDIYSGKKMQAMITITSNDVIINSEKVLLNWLNAEEYHRDKDKKEFLEELYKSFPEDASKTIFLNLLRDKTQAIYNLAGICRVVIGQNNKIRLQVKAN